MPRENFTIPGGITVDQSTLHVDDPNNRVGIGTEEPDQSLDVVGNVVASGWVKGTEGVVVPTSSGAPSTTIADGAIAVDSTNHALYFRSGSTWRLQTSGGGATGPTGPTGATGPTGPSGIVESASAPESTNVLWLDTDEPGDAVIPIGGTTGQVLVKNSTSDYDASWGQATPAVGTSLGTSDTVDLNMATLNGTYQSIALAGNITFTTSNRAAGRSVTVRLSAGGSSRTLAFPAWVFVGATAPTSLASGKTGLLTVTFFDTTDAGAVAAWAAQP